MKALTELRNCPICDSPEYRPLVQYNKFQYYTDQEENQIDLIHVNCTNCDALYMNPAFTDYGFSRLFAKAAGSYGSTSTRSQEQVNWMEKAGLLTNCKSILDIGCYFGNFLSLLPTNIERYGLEIDSGVVEEAKAKRPGINFFCSTFDNISLPNKVELVTMFHVLEHLVSPVEFLRNLKGQLDSQAKLLIEIPIVENSFTNDTCGFFNAQHTTHFSLVSAKQALERAGWAIVTEEVQDEYNGYRMLCKIKDISPELQPWFASENQFQSRQKTLEYFKIWYASLQQIEHTLQAAKSMAKEKPLVIWGGGMHTEFLYHNTSLKEIIRVSKDCTVIDLDAAKQGQKWRGINIVSPDKFSDWGNAVFIPSSYFHHDKIRENLQFEHAVKPEKIIKLYDYIRTY